MKITVSEIEKQSRAALLAHGAGQMQAAAVAKAVARAEALGNVICGLYYLESYCTQLASGRVNGTVMPKVSRPRPGAILADAQFGFAQPAFDAGLPEAVAAALENGVATLAVAHAHTCTSLGYFTEQIAAAGLIGIGFTNASPVVAPPGGNKRVIGTNPIAMTVPGDGKPAMHFDFSTSAVALGKITMANGFEYDGQWQTGEINGIGTATYDNGDIYEGRFLKGKRQGSGTMRYATGEEATGTWENGALKEDG